MCVKMWIHLPRNCSHSFPRRQKLPLTDDYLVGWFNSVCRALEHFEVLLEELEKLAEVRMFGAFLLKIWLLVTKITENLEAWVRQNNIVPFAS